MLAVVQVGCPGHEWTDALAIVGFCALVLVAGVLAAVTWEYAGVRARKRFEEAE